MNRSILASFFSAAVVAGCNSAGFSSQSPASATAKQQDSAAARTSRPAAHETPVAPQTSPLPAKTPATIVVPPPSTDANATSNSQVQVQQTDATDVLYAGPKVFHVGDGKDAGSSCLGELNSYPVVGTTYWFEFTVSTPGTTVNVKVSDLCGVDYHDSNFLMIVPGGTGGTDFSQHVLIPFGGQSSVTLQSTPLPPGRYAAAVKSTRGTSSPGASPTDADDFIFANVAITGSSPIAAGPVNATSEPDCKEAVTDPSGDTGGCSSGSDPFGLTIP